MISKSTIIVVEQAVLDDQGVLRVDGWAAGLARVERIDIVAGGVRLGEARYGLLRPDVAADHPEFPDAGRCGFDFAAPLDGRAREAAQVVAIAHLQGQTEKAATA